MTKSEGKWWCEKHGNVKGRVVNDPKDPYIPARRIMVCPICGRKVVRLTGRGPRIMRYLDV